MIEVKNTAKLLSVFCGLLFDYLLSHEKRVTSER